MLQINQIVVGIGVEGRPAIGGGPAGLQDRVGETNFGSTGVAPPNAASAIEYGQILRDRAI